MEQISDGAEAIIYRDGDRIVKERREKRYRHPALDERLRTERTEREARLLRKARQAGVPVPEVLAVETHTLVLEMIDGTPLRDVLERSADRWLEIGVQVGRLHGRGIIHGDLTTSNLIRTDDALYVIDFGLGFFSDRVEDQAVDLHLLREVFDSTHTAIADEAMTAVLDGYRETRDEVDAVMDRFEEIESRGRYQ